MFWARLTDQSRKVKSKVKSCRKLKTEMRGCLVFLEFANQFWLGWFSLLVALFFSCSFLLVGHFRMRSEISY